MKRINIIKLAVLAVAVLASCSKDKNIPMECSGIRFDINPSSELTKAKKVDLEGLRSNGFQVFANIREEGSAATTPLMNAQKMTYNGSGWVYYPVKYWPTSKTASVDFYPAYTDGSENVKILTDWFNKPQTTVYINDVVSKQTDMLWSAPVFNAKKDDYKDSSVTFKFKHSLTAFFYRIKLASDPGDQIVKVRSLTLTGFFATKAYVNPDETDLAKAYTLQGAWQEHSYTISKDGDKEVSTAASDNPLTTSAVDLTGEKGLIMLLPFDYQEYTLTLVYDVTNGSNTITYSTSYTSSGLELEAGTIINTLLVLQPKVKVDVDGSISSVTSTPGSWSDGEDALGGSLASMDKVNAAWE